jgi:hypothetical protein
MAIDALKTYDPSEVVVAVGGALLASWNQVTAEFAEDQNLMSTGTTGETTRTKNANRTGTVTINIPQTSTDNAILNALALTNSVVNVSIVDKSGTIVITIPEGVFQKVPNIVLGKDAADGSRDWLLTGKLFMVGGGN